MDLISIAIDTAPLGSDAATIMSFEVRPIKVLFTAQLLAYFLQFFLAPPDVEKAVEELEVSMSTAGHRANANKMMDGMKALVIDALKQRQLVLHLLVHRLEILWVEHRMPVPGKVTPVDHGAATCGGESRSGSSNAPCMHLLVVRADEVVFDWEEPPPVAPEPIVEPRVQTFAVKVKSAGALFPPPTLLPSTWLTRDDIVDQVVGAVGWGIDPIPNLVIRFVCTLDQLAPSTLSRTNGSLFHTRFNLDFSADGPVSFHWREGHALTVAAMVMSLVRCLAPLLNMMDTNCRWPLSGDGMAGWLNVSEANGTGALAVAKKAAKKASKEAAKEAADDNVLQPARASSSTSTEVPMRPKRVRPCAHGVVAG